MPSEQISIEFRLADESDTPTIAHLVNQAYRPESSHSGWTHEGHLLSGTRTHAAKVHELILAHDSAVIVACRERAIVACIHVQKRERHCYLGLFAVHPSEQGKGLGKTMLAYAENHSIQTFGVEKFVMHVISQRADLLSFYERRGYRRTGQTEPYPISSGVGTPKLKGLSIETLEKPASRLGLSAQPTRYIGPCSLTILITNRGSQHGNSTTSCKN